MYFNIGCKDFFEGWCVYYGKLIMFKIEESC